MDQHVVMFVCAHGAGRSRLAAAWFNGLGLDDWIATSAGVEPQPQVSPHAPRLLSGTPVEELLDREPPRPLTAVSAPAVTVEIDCAGAIPGAITWTLQHQEFDQAMNEEIRDRVQLLAGTLNGGDQPGAGASGRA